MSDLERVASIVGTILIGTAAFLIFSDQSAAKNRKTLANSRPDHPVEELADELKQAWSGYHNR